MSNLEEVVKERNRAYYELETGETGERPGKLVYNQLGLFLSVVTKVTLTFVNKAIKNI